MSILGKSGRIAIAKAIKAQTLHMAWGPGDGAWTQPPPEDVNAEEIAAEIGRRVATAQYVALDPDGEIETPPTTPGGDDGKKYSLSATPTNFLLISARFRFNDSPDAVVRQVGVYVDGEIVSGLPAGQQYFTPYQVAKKGDLLQIQNRRPLNRSSDARTTISIIVQF